MQLSKNFTLQEFTKSQTAIRYNIDNTPSSIHIENLIKLCTNILQPVRDHYNVPMTISSGYRSPELSNHVGSKSTSQHCNGEAADFEIPGISNYDVADYIMNHYNFDQLILEFYTPGDENSGWIHISYKSEYLNRNSVLTAYRKNNTLTYQKGLIK